MYYTPDPPLFGGYPYVVGQTQELRRMTLTLKMLRCPDTVAPETRVLQGGEFSIGRGSENDWVLPDPERFLSKRHCMLAYRSGGWQIADLSTNGTFLNGEAEPIGHGQPRDLRDGDRLRLGAYEIELRIAEDAIPRGRLGHRADPFALDPFALAPAHRRADRFDQDPLLRARPEQDPFRRASSRPRSTCRPTTTRSRRSRPKRRLPARPNPTIRRISRTRSARLWRASLLPDDWDREPAPQAAARRRRLHRRPQNATAGVAVA